MIERRGELRFALEAPPRRRVGDVGGQKLDRDRAIQLRIDRAVDGAHAAFAEQLLESIDADHRSRRESAHDRRTRIRIPPRDSGDRPCTYGEAEGATRLLPRHGGIEAEDVLASRQPPDVHGKRSPAIRKVLPRQGQQLFANRPARRVHDRRPHGDRRDDVGALSSLVHLHERTDLFVRLEHASRCRRRHRSGRRGPRGRATRRLHDHIRQRQWSAAKQRNGDRTEYAGGDACRRIRHGDTHLIVARGNSTCVCTFASARRFNVAGLNVTVAVSRA